LKTTTGESLNGRTCYREITIQLGNLQYGQSRDIYLENVDKLKQQTAFKLYEKNRYMDAKLNYSLREVPQEAIKERQDLLKTSSLSQSVVAYHQSRSMICQLFSSFSQKENDQYTNMSDGDLGQFRVRLREVISKIPAKDYEDEYNRSLMEDLNGQVTEGLSSREFFSRWGGHYFFSLWNAHAKQL
jgi:hypothetical protein